MKKKEIKMSTRIKDMSTKLWNRIKHEVFDDMEGLDDKEKQEYDSKVLLLIEEAFKEFKSR